MKLIIGLTIFTNFLYQTFLITAPLTTGEMIPHSWGDFSVGEQIQIITGLSIIIITMISAFIIFKSVWIRKGYEGVDEMLEAKEVATMLSHVIAFICLITFQYLVTFNPYVKNPFPDFVFWISASGFLGPEIYLLVNFIKNLSNHSKEKS